MFACVLCVFMLYVAVSECVTVRRHRIEPVTKYREALSPLLITCTLNDIVFITTPSIRYNTDTLYYLHKPNGDVIELNITSTTPEWPQYDEESNYIGFFGLMKNEDRLTFPKSSYRVDNVNFVYKVDSKTSDVFRKGNEFIIGPLMEEDHGNWVLSMYYSEDGSWLEMFQVITIEIIERVPTEPSLPVLRPGDTLKLGFAYPINHLEGCQLTIPKSSYDRYYELASSDSCVYIIRNVTEDDAGTWEIRGVGRIAYEARTQLKVRKDNKVT